MPSGIVRMLSCKILKLFLISFVLSVLCLWQERACKPPAESALGCRSSSSSRAERKFKHARIRVLSIVRLHRCESNRMFDDVDQYINLCVWRGGFNIRCKSWHVSCPNQMPVRFSWNNEAVRFDSLLYLSCTHKWPYSCFVLDVDFALFFRCRYDRYSRGLGAYMKAVDLDLTTVSCRCGSGMRFSPVVARQLNFL